MRAGGGDDGARVGWAVEGMRRGIWCSLKPKAKVSVGLRASVFPRGGEGDSCSQSCRC